VIIVEDDVYGDGVNIAARLEALADPGSVVISSAVFEQVRDRVPDSFEDLGDQRRSRTSPAHPCTPSKRPTLSLLRFGTLNAQAGTDRAQAGGCQRRKSKTP
jgi:class 3 adenylate cyclase